MSSAVAEPPSLNELFRAITAIIREKPAYASIVTRHIATAHGIHTLPAFLHTREVSDMQKRDTLEAIAQGIARHIEGHDHGLLGSAAAGQAETPQVETEQSAPPAVLHKETARPEPAAAEVDAEAEATLPPAPAAKPSARKSAPAAEDPLTAQLRHLIKEIVGPIEGALDTKKVNALIDVALKKYDGDMAKALNAIVGKISEVRKSAQDALARALAEVDKKIAAIPAAQPRTLEIKVGKAVNKVEGLTHRQFLQIATWVAADVPVWAWGSAGGGKTTLGEQVAQALGIPFTCISIDETITVGKLVGFKNLSTGEYVEGLLYRVYKEGGLVLLDEIDTNATTMASLNAMLANDHYTFGNGERVQRHKDFRVLAGANTKGTGAVAGYTARVRLDAATLDRFAVIELAYDWDMVEGIALGTPVKSHAWKPVFPADAATLDRWVKWVKKVSGEFGKSMLVSPRAALLGVKALRAGVPVEEVAQALVFKLMTEDAVKRVLSSAPLPSYASAAS